MDCYDVSVVNVVRRGTVKVKEGEIFAIFVIRCRDPGDGIGSLESGDVPEDQRVRLGWRCIVVVVVVALVGPSR